MHAPITVNYVPDGEDWTITVTDEAQTESATASGLIAARDQADQIVEKMVPSQTSRTVVHLLEGDAVAFTNTYLQARLGLTTPSPAAPIPAPAEAATVPAAPPAAAPESSAQQTATQQPQPPTPTPSTPHPEAPHSQTSQPEAPHPQPPHPQEAEAPTRPNQDQDPSLDKDPELANVPAQGAEQVS